jgi:hypothetical protein
MEPEQQYRALSAELAPLLRSVEGFHALSGDDAGITAYVEPKPGVAEAVEKLIRQHHATVPIRFVPTGDFRSL